ncbi:MAG TPA: DNA mismatch repair protein MutS, partial [Chitinophagaceae bacterium]|nr:DNA mismatch repair protein MutS [Chitinophagaceae bacterium]
NLLVFSFQVKRIRRSLFSSEKTHALLQAYSAILLRIENTTYTSPLLKALQQKLYAGNQKAGTLLQKLAAIYSGMETVQNPFAAVITNGLYLNHIHLLSRLIRWRRQYAAQIPEWLEVIGAFEMLGSLANFHDNHPGFCFPRLNKEEMIRFKEMGHPLLSAAKRINNDACFDSYRFMILTGSNMSGKSTFLRTLGVNMILSGMGSVVCAVDADVHPMPVFVSMRQSDSLADSESYFFAEVKRLKYIMDQMDEGAVFVLLDEILRGTNSDDKRSGTVGVIEKISGKKVYGAIATHDLEVCLTTDKYPGILSNKCFEVEIRNDELVFDYKLREGICRNKSATFLMKKMKII